MMVLSCSLSAPPSLLRGKVEGTGIVQLGEEKTPGRPHYGLPELERNT